MSKVILFGVLIFYSNFGVSVSYSDELANQREYWPSSWSGNDHPRRQLRNDGFAQTRHEKLVQPVNNHEYIESSAVDSSRNNLYKPAVQPVPDKQLLRNFGPPETKRQLAPEQQSVPQDETYRHNVERFEVKPGHEQFRNQVWKPQVQHQSSLKNQDQRSYVLPTGTDYRREHNTNPTNVAYHNVAGTENVANRHIVKQGRPYRPKTPIPYLNLSDSNAKASKLEEPKHTQETASSFAYANNNPVPSEVLRRKASESNHDVGANNNAPYLIPNYLAERNENHNVAPHGYKDSFVGDRVPSNYRETSDTGGAITKNVVVNHVDKNVPENVVDENKYHRVEPIRRHHNSPKVISNNLANKHQDPRPIRYNNPAVSGLREAIPQDGYNNKRHNSPTHLANTDSINASPVHRDYRPDNNYNSNAEEKPIVKERKSENSGYTSNKNPGQWENVPAVSYNVLEKPNKRRYEEADQLGFGDQVDAPARNDYSLPLPLSVRQIKHENNRHITNERGSQKPNSRPLNGPELLRNDDVSRLENSRYTDDFRPHFEKHEPVPLNTYNNAPAVVNQVNNREGIRYVSNDSPIIKNDNSPPRNAPVLPNNVEKINAPGNRRHIENYNDAPRNSYDNNPAFNQHQNHVPDRRIVDDKVDSYKRPPTVSFHDQTYQPKNNRFVDNIYQEPIPVYNPNNAVPELEYVENIPEDSKYFDNPNKRYETYDDALEAISELQANKHEEQAFPIYGPISPSRGLTFVNAYDNAPSSIHNIPPNYKSADQAIPNNEVPNVPSETVNSNVEKVLPKQENYNKPAFLEPDSNIPRTQETIPQIPTKVQNFENNPLNPAQKHVVRVLPDGTLENVNAARNPDSSKIISKDPVNNIQDKVVEETSAVQFPEIKPNLTTTTTPVPTVAYISDINSKISQHYGNKGHQEEPPVESPPVDITSSKLIAPSQPVQDEALPTDTNVPVDNNDESLVKKETDYEPSPLVLPAIVGPQPVQEVSNEPNKQVVLPTSKDFTPFVTTPYPYATTASPIELAPDNVYDAVVTTTVRPAIESSKIVENDEVGKINEVQNDQTNVIPSVESSQNKESEITPELVRKNINKDIAKETHTVTTNDVTQSENKPDGEQIINQQKESRINGPVVNNVPSTSDVLTRGDDKIIEDKGINSGTSSGKRLVSKATPNGVKLVLDPINLSDEDTITIAIELSEAPDNGGAFNENPRNNADGYSNEVSNSREDLSRTNSKHAARTRNNHHNRHYEHEEPLYLVPIEQLPAMEKETVITQYPNGTTITVITEIVYDNFQGTPPKITRTENIENPKE
ncbi:unnamed protein product [Chrysodeixis includens]|uniref:Uncharacterized protein n=1 Tax=Chrysodeixis includens TaxID=689277 RepID=A0A9P0C4D4_CHRIL|nr:unnamed protein product [Chrysodeixis includens]